MAQSQSGFINTTRASGAGATGTADLDRAVSFRFVVTWSCLAVAADPSRPVMEAVPAVQLSECPRPIPAPVPAPRVMPAPQQSPPVTALVVADRTNAEELVPATKNARSGSGFQWEMVVPKMVRAPKKAAATKGRAPNAAAVEDQTGPNLYTASSGFRKSFSLKLCIVVVAGAAIAVPLWRRAARPPGAAVESSIEGGDWLRESAVGGDPGVKLSRQLVLYKPALKARDCRLEFSWTVASGDVGVVFRAKDLGNYYAARLKVLKLGSTPTLAAEYFSVYEFVESPHTEKVLVFSRNDPVLRVRMDVFGPMFTLYLQDNATEYWTDARLTSGAIGFFEEWNRSPDVHTLRMSFPERSLLFRRPFAGRQFLATNEPRSGGV
jgi:hypothetical protein